MATKVKYVSAAKAPSSIDLNTIYDFKRDANGYYLEHDAQQIRVSLSFAKAFLSPIGATWDELIADKPVARRDTNKRKRKAIS